VLHARWLPGVRARHVVATAGDVPAGHAFVGFLCFTRDLQRPPGLLPPRRLHEEQPRRHLLRHREEGMLSNCVKGLEGASLPSDDPNAPAMPRARRRTRPARRHARRLGPVAGLSSASLPLARPSRAAAPPASPATRIVATSRSGQLGPQHA